MSNDAVGRRVGEHLKKKYGVDVVVDAVGGGFGTSDNSTWKVIFHSESDPALRSYATVSKSDGTVHDFLAGDFLADSIAQSLEGDAKTVLGGRVLIAAHLRHEATGVELNEIWAPGMESADFFSANPDARLMLAVLWSDSPRPEIDANKLRTIAARVASDVPRAWIYIAPVDSATYDEMTASYGTSELQDIEQKSKAFVTIDGSIVGTPTIDPVD